MDAIEFGKSIAILVREAVAKGLEGIASRLAVLEDRLKNLPAPKDGEDGADGKSFTLDDARPVVAEAVREAVAALPTPKDGVSPTVEEVLPPVLEAMRAAVAELPPPAPGTSVTLDDVRPLIDEAVKALPPATPGEPGTSVKAEDVLPELREQVAEFLRALQVPKDGKSPSVEEVAQALLPDIDKALDGLHARWALDFERRAQDLFQRTLDRIPAPKDGLDGLGFDDLHVEYDGERSVTIKFQRGEQLKAFELSLPIVIDRGFWLDGKSAEPGDGYTFGGSYWIAQKATATKPEIGNSDWRLAVKKGRDGKA